jgi:hypothetical protein
MVRGLVLLQVVLLLLMVRAGARLLLFVITCIRLEMLIHLMVIMVQLLHVLVWRPGVVAGARGERTALRSVGLIAGGVACGATCGVVVIVGV